MSLHFITSINQEYWDIIAKRCISTWDLPGSITVYIDQQQGNLDWIKEVPYHCELLHVPKLTSNAHANNAKVRKFWGKSVSQIHAVEHRGTDRIVWLDADIEQLQPISTELFDFEFDEPVALMNSGQLNDEWESGLVIFNQAHGKLDQFMKHYHNNWNDDEIIASLYKPYDAPVIGHTATQRGYINLCDTLCDMNKLALEHTRYHGYLKHWIGKDNKHEISSSLSL
jgi:hypothetical protein